MSVLCFLPSDEASASADTVPRHRHTPLHVISSYSIRLNMMLVFRLYIIPLGYRVHTPLKCFGSVCVWYYDTVIASHVNFFPSSKRPKPDSLYFVTTLFRFSSNTFWKTCDTAFC